MLIYAGIDEAGYGPALGPMSAACWVFSVDGWEPGDPAPDLWERLGSAVCRSPRDAKARIAVDDSKKLKRPNSLKTGHPLDYLERGVLSWLRAIGGAAHPVSMDADLAGSLGCAFPERAWYSSETSLPVARDAEQLRIDANMLRSACDRAGVTPIASRAVLLSEDRFNRVVSRGGGKAEAALVCTGELLRFAIDAARNRASRVSRGGAEPVSLRVVCDRLGGRMHYADALARVTGLRVRTLSETPERSRYQLDHAPPGPAAQHDSGHGDEDHGGSREAPEMDVGVEFCVEADAGHLPVALASMTAKYLRELAMIRFNRYWSERIEGLTPTAGYRGDAGRWLRDAAGARENAVTPDERRALVRIA